MVYWLLKGGRRGDKPMTPERRPINPALVFTCMAATIEEFWDDEQFRTIRLSKTCGEVEQTLRAMLAARGVC